jgi:hypothetical protein
MQSLYTLSNFPYTSLASNQIELQNVTSDQLFLFFTFSYEITQNINITTEKNGQFTANINGNIIDDIFMSIQFKSTNLVIDNISLPLTLGKHQITIQTQFYNGNPIYFYSNFFQYMININISGVHTSNSLISPYLISTTQNATAIDGNVNIYVFYINSQTNNIDVAISYDNGDNWQKYTSLIRLLNTESVSQPVTIVDKNSNIIYLFYILNNSYLMMKKIDVKLFNCSDLFIIYQPLSSFTATSPNNDGLTAYSL